MLKIRKKTLDYISLWTFSHLSLSYLPAKATNPTIVLKGQRRFHHITSASSEARVRGQRSAYLRSQGRKWAEQKSWWDPNARRKHTHVWDSSLLPSATFKNTSRYTIHSTQNKSCLSFMQCVMFGNIEREGKHLHITSCHHHNIF